MIDSKEMNNQFKERSKEYTPRDLGQRARTDKGSSRRHSNT